MDGTFYLGDRLLDGALRFIDIALGHTTGIVTVLVLNGVTTPDDWEDSLYQPTYTFANLRAVADWPARYGRSILTP